MSSRWDCCTDLVVQSKGRNESLFLRAEVVGVDDLIVRDLRDGVEVFFGADDQYVLITQADFSKRAISA